jgi:protein-S-isoprenylcysteine O-methyltransferase Ste14
MRNLPSIRGASTMPDAQTAWTLDLLATPRSQSRGQQQRLKDYVMSKILGSAAKFLMGAVLFVGLPLLGWGVTDFRGFVGHPARLTYVVLVILVQVGVVVKFPDVGRDSGEGRQTVRRQRVAVILLQVLSLSIVLAAPPSDRWAVAALGESQIVRIFGLILFPLGFIVMNWAEASLGSQFSVQVTLQEGHQLVTSGPYRHLRHPRYLGIIVFNVGIALIFRSGLALALVAALVGVLLWRMHDEETLMRQAFGGEWDSYSKRSRRLIPFVF